MTSLKKTISSIKVIPNLPIIIIVLLSACSFEQEAQLPLPKVKVYASNPIAYRSASALFDSLSTNVETPSPSNTVPEQWLVLEAQQQRFWADTLQLHWHNNSNEASLADSILLYKDQKLLGRYMPQEAIPINDSINELWIKVCYPKRSICIQPEAEHSYCLLKSKPSRLASIQQIAGLDCKPDSVVASFFPLKKQSLQELPLAYMGLGEKERITSLGFQSTGAFTATSEAWEGFGKWQWISEGESIALEGRSPKSDGIWKDTVSVESKGIRWQGKLIPQHLPDSAFVAIRQLHDFEFDLRYATDNNFMEKAVYPCGDCWLRYEAALAIVEAQKSLQKQGYSLLLYDCYRPLSVQKFMWEVYPNPMYVANPHKGIGSIHNRGGAVDLTVIDSNGQALDMGSPFDYFGKEAHQDNFDLPEKVLANRAILREAMVAAGFRTIRTEWWHYSYQNKTKFTVADVEIECGSD